MVLSQSCALTSSPIRVKISFVISVYSHRSGAVSQCSLDIHILECPTAVLLRSQLDKHGWSAAQHSIFNALFLSAGQREPMIPQQRHQRQRQTLILQNAHVPDLLVQQQVQCHLTATVMLVWQMAENLYSVMLGDDEKLNKTKALCSLTTVESSMKQKNFQRSLQSRY